MQGFDLLLDIPHHRVGRYRNLVIQVRTGHFDTGDLERLGAVLRTEMRRQSNEKVGLLGVIEATADVPDDAARAGQRALATELSTMADLQTCVLVPGDGVETMLRRTIARGVTLKTNRKSQVVGTAEEAADFLMVHMDLPRSEILTAIALARRLPAP